MTFESGAHQGGDYTRVYLLSSRAHHLLPPGESPNNTAARSLCGITNWPGYWRGTANYGEMQQAKDMPLCQSCQRMRNDREATEEEG